MFKISMMMLVFLGLKTLCQTFKQPFKDKIYLCRISFFPCDISHVIVDC